jgi:hypothetical protein
LKDLTKLKGGATRLLIPVLEETPRAGCLKVWCMIDNSPDVS